MRQTQVVAQAEERKHQWVDVSEKPDSYWETRRCLICELQDMRLRDRSKPHSRNKWEVSTPCIEPVPDTISFEELKRELAEHNVSEKPWAVGHPGKWTVGFYMGTFPYPMLDAKGRETLEHGFAKLLRWVRARQYNLNRYSRFEEERRRANYVHPCEDDD